IEVEADGRLPPAAGAHGMKLLAQMPGKRQHERDGKLGRCQPTAAGAAYRDIALPGRLDVDGGIALSRRYQQPQVWQPFEQGARKWGALAHDADDIERLEGAHRGLDVGQALIEDHQTMLALKL